MQDALGVLHGAAGGDALDAARGTLDLAREDFIAGGQQV